VAAANGGSAAIERGASTRILLVEDDAALGEGIRTALKPEGYTVDWLQDGASAWHALSHESFELCVLDLGLPRMDGLEVLRRLRAAGNLLPVLVLTARDATGDRIAGLDAGADDYLIKPFDVAELNARLRALLRRSFGRAESALEYRGIRLEPDSQRVTFQGAPVNLARKEFLLLHELLAQPGRVLTRDKLQQVLYGWDEEVESNALEVHVHHLRKKFFPELIRTVRGVGYLVDKA
jgi:two-component system response regulator QseB